MAGRDAREADYAAAGFSARLGAGDRPALLLIDLVGAYFIEGASLYLARPDVLRNARPLLDAARAAGAPVIHTKVAYQAGGADGGVFFRKVPALKAFAPGADPALGALCEAVAPRADEIVITKQYASAFFGTSLAATLTALRVDTLVIGGVSTSGCVRASAVDACQHGFVPLVVRDACADRDLATHESNLFDLDAKYADVVDLKAGLAALSARKG